MRRPNADHLSQAWRVHSLAEDFDLLDVWRFPIRARHEIPFEMFLDFLEHNQAELREGPGLAAWLFRLRAWLGSIFGWDEETTQPPATSPDSVSHRLARDDLAASGMRPERERAALPFTTVYRTEHERLDEIQNATVHALMHLGRVDVDGGWSPQMAVYVKRKGALGRFYMALIGPFRHAIVYPAMMRAAERGWPRFLAERQGPNAG